MSTKATISGGDDFHQLYIDFRLHRCPWCGYLFNLRELEDMRRRMKTNG